jgi:hypothetical protein
VKEIIELVGAVVQVLLPIGVEMVTAAMGGGDPMAALLKERVDAVIPSPLRLTLARKAEAARRAHAARTP